MLTRIGRDAFGAMALRLWRDAGVTSAATEHDEPTGAALIYVDDASGENAIIVCPGAAGGLSAVDVEARADLVAGASVLLCQLEQPMEAALRALQIAREAGVTTILNPAPAAALPDGLLALCDHVTPNEAEAEALTGLEVRDLDGARRAADRLRALGAGAATITLGARGALHCGEGVAELVPAMAAGPVVETTGGGGRLQRRLRGRARPWRPRPRRGALRLRGGGVVDYPPGRRRRHAVPRRDPAIPGRPCRALRDLTRPPTPPRCGPGARG